MGAAARVYGAGAGKKMVELLLERGANPLMRDSVGRLAQQLTRDLGIQEVLGKAELWWRRRPVFWIRCKGNERSVFNWLLQEHLEAVASFLTFGLFWLMWLEHSGAGTSSGIWQFSIGLLSGEATDWQSSAHGEVSVTSGHGGSTGL